MAVTAETRTHLIGLSVVMLGSAPGTDLLNEWIEAMDGGATLEDIANHIAASDAFQATYPPLQTNREFAEDMLESLIGSEVVPGVLRAAAADIVVSLLNDGMTRGALALAVVGALSDIAAQGEEHPAYGDLGNVAHAIANKTEVAAHHTIEKRIAEPSSDALAGVTSDAATVEAAIRDIDSPPADAVFDEVGTLSVTENADGSGMPGDDNAPISAGYVTATDSNGDAVSYSIEGDPADWMILEDGKLCYVGAGLDHEAGDAVSLNIVATSIGADGAETSVVRNVSVMVGDVQESDAVFADATLAIDENETAGMVGSVTATDAEDDAVTYRLADGSPEGFSIDAETGAVSYAGEGLDHETAATVDLTVIATSIGASNMETDVSRTFTVMVGDVQESDAVFADATLAIDENETAGMVGSVAATDAEDDAVTYRLADGSPEGFSIDEETGAVSYAGEGLDHETAATVDLTVIATSIGASNMETDVSRTFTVMVGDVDDLPITLGPAFDDKKGGDADDIFIARPVQGASLVFEDTLNRFDRIDGGEGTDTIYIAKRPGTLELGSSHRISNVENVELDASEGIDADLTTWSGVEKVTLLNFGNESDVSITIDDGAVVYGTYDEDRPFGGDVTIVGSAGDVSINAGGTSNVHIGSAGHTRTVMVTGGGNITVDNGAGKSSQTVTSVSVSGVAHNTGTSTTEASGTFAPLTNTNGFLVGQNGSTQISITTGGSGGTATTPVGLDDDGVTLTNAFDGTAITGAYTWDHDGDGTDTSATPAQTAGLAVTAELKFDVNTGGLVFGEITAITGYTLTDGVFVDDGDATNTIQPDSLDGTRVPPSTAFTSQDIGKEDADPVTTTVGGGPTLTVKSDAIADVTLASTHATILVENGSKTEDDKAMPEDLAITLNEYGTSKVTGKLCVAGSGSAENIMLTVAGDSWVDLNSNVVKMLDVTADAKLSLSVSKFNSDGMPDGASETLESVMISGDGAVSMNSLGGMKKLASIDASGSSGNNSFKSDAVLAALTSVMGGSGNDTVSVSADEDGKLESIMTGDGGDSVTISGDYREDGLMVDLGDGDDSFDGNAGNSMSRVDGGDGRDTLTLSSDGATYKNDDDKDVSIYSNFEILDVGGGSGTYNVGLLGVDTIIVNASTTGTGVELDDVGGSISLSVSSSRNAVTGAASATSATIDYNLDDDVNSAGSLIDGNTSSILNVSLMAVGGKGDSKGTQTGEATLTLDLDTDLRGVIIDSNAGVHGAAAGKGATSGRYENTVTITASAIEEVKITGNAQTKLTATGTGLAALKYVNAAESGGGVTVNATTSAVALRLVGSQQDDMLTAGSFAQTATSRNTLIGNGGDDTLVAGAGGGALVGGAGADMMTGAAGTDLFVINSASESQVNFKKGEDDDGNTIYTAEGYDTIAEFTSDTDKLHFSKALHAIVTAGQIVGNAAISNGFKAANEWDGWMTTDTDGNPATTVATDGVGAVTSTIRIDGDVNRASLGADGAVGGGDDVVADGGATDLREFIGNGKGLFLTSSTVTSGAFGSTTRTYKNSIAAIQEDANANGTADAGDGDGLWLLIDVNGDGDFSAADDMVIFLAGTFTFDPAADITS